MHPCVLLAILFLGVFTGCGAQIVTNGTIPAAVISDGVAVLTGGGLTGLKGFTLAPSTVPFTLPSLTVGSSPSNGFLNVPEASIDQLTTNNMAILATGTLDSNNTNALSVNVNRLSVTGPSSLGNYSGNALKLQGNLTVNGLLTITGTMSAEDASAQNFTTGYLDVKSFFGVDTGKLTVGGPTTLNSALQANNVNATNWASAASTIVSDTTNFVTGNFTTYSTGSLTANNVQTLVLNTSFLNVSSNLNIWGDLNTWNYVGSTLFSNGSMFAFGSDVQSNYWTQGLNVSGNLAGGATTVNNQAALGGNLNVSGAFTVSGAANFQGNSSLGSDFQIGKALYVGGSVGANNLLLNTTGAWGNLQVAGSASVAKDLTLVTWLNTTSLNVTSGLAITNDLTVAGNLNVFDTTSVTSVTSQNAIRVLNNNTLSSLPYIDSPTIVTVTNDLVVQSLLNSTNLLVNDETNLSGNVTAGTLAVNVPANFYYQTTINANLTVSSNTFVQDGTAAALEVVGDYVFSKMYGTSATVSNLTVYGYTSLNFIEVKRGIDNGGKRELLINGGVKVYDEILADDLEIVFDIWVDYFYSNGSITTGGSLFNLPTITNANVSNLAEANSVSLLNVTNIDALGPMNITGNLTTDVFIGQNITLNGVFNNDTTISSLTVSGNVFVAENFFAMGETFDIQSLNVFDLSVNSYFVASDLLAGVQVQIDSGNAALLGNDASTLNIINVALSGGSTVFQINAQGSQVNLGVQGLGNTVQGATTFWSLQAGTVNNPAAPVLSVSNGNITTNGRFTILNAPAGKPYLSILDTLGENSSFVVDHNYLNMSASFVVSQYTGTFVMAYGDSAPGGVPRTGTWFDAVLSSSLTDGTHDFGLRIDFNGDYYLKAAEIDFTDSTNLGVVLSTQNFVVTQLTAAQYEAANYSSSNWTGALLATTYNNVNLGIEANSQEIVLHTDLTDALVNLDNFGTFTEILNFYERSFPISFRASSLFVVMAGQLYLPAIQSRITILTACNRLTAVEFPRSQVDFVLADEFRYISNATCAGVATDDRYRYRLQNTKGPQPRLFGRTITFFGIEDINRAKSYTAIQYLKSSYNVTNVPVKTATPCPPGVGVGTCPQYNVWNDLISIDSGANEGALNYDYLTNGGLPGTPTCTGSCCADPKLQALAPDMWSVTIMYVPSQSNYYQPYDPNNPLYTDSSLAVVSFFAVSEREAQSNCTTTYY